MSWPSAVPRYHPFAMRKTGGFSVPLSASTPSLLHSYGNVANSNQPSRVPTFYTWKTLMNPRQCPSHAQRMQLALPQRVYHPFHYEANDFFRLPISIYQLSMRAAERGWANPVWFREDTVRLLHLNPLPFEAPIALWLPQTGDTYRLLSSFIPRVQHYILRRFHFPPGLPSDRHVLLAADWKRYMATPETDIEFIGHSSPSFKWQNCISQLAPLFDSAYDIAAPHFARRRPSDVFSDHSRKVPNNQQLSPNHPHKKMWVSTAAARFAHAESYLWINSSVPHSSTVVTPFHGGLMFNAAQLHSNSTITEKTLEVLELIRQQHRDDVMGLNPVLVEHSNPQMHEAVAREAERTPSQGVVSEQPAAVSNAEGSLRLSDEEMMAMFDSELPGLPDDGSHELLAAEAVDANEELRMLRDGSLPPPCASAELHLEAIDSLDESIDFAAQADFHDADHSFSHVLSSLPEAGLSTDQYPSMDIDQAAQVDLSLSSQFPSPTDMMDLDNLDDDYDTTEDIDSAAAADDRDTLVAVLQQHVHFCATMPCAAPPGGGKGCPVPTSILPGVSFEAGGMA